jgi:hypothetical protein
MLLYYCVTFRAHAQQYFSITVTPSPTSKQTTWVARLPQVEQYFALSLGLLTNGRSDNRNFTIYFTFLPNFQSERLSEIWQLQPLRKLWI